MNFEFNGFTVRILDLRPNQDAVQVNVYNPSDSTHCTAKSIQVNPAPSLDDIKTALIDSGQLQTITDRAAVIFGV